MNWDDAQLLIVPALTVLFQALKKIAVIGEDNQYIPLASILLGLLVTLAWAITGNECNNACQFVAGLKGVVYGAAAVGLYEAFKPKAK